MTEFYETGVGKNLFGSEQVLTVEVSKSLQVQFENTINGFIKPG